MIYIPENAKKQSFTHICSDYPALLWRQTYSYTMNQHTLLFVEYNIEELSHIFSKLWIQNTRTLWAYGIKFLLSKNDNIYLDYLQ